MILETPEGQQDLRQGTKMESEKRNGSNDSKRADRT